MPSTAVMAPYLLVRPACEITEVIAVSHDHRAAVEVLGRADERVGSDRAGDQPAALPVVAGHQHAQRADGDERALRDGAHARGEPQLLAQRVASRSRSGMASRRVTPEP